MIPAGQVTSPWILYILYGSLCLFSAASLCLFLAIRHLTRHCQHPFPTEQSEPWSQSSTMEKAKSATPSAPPATACDVLKPLSSNGSFPSSGAVAARAREQMANAGNSSYSNSSSPATEASSPSQPGSDSLGSVQKRSETVQQLREEDANGVRTWRRLIVEYN